MLLAGVCSLSNVIGVLILVLFSSTASFTKAQQQQQQQVNLFCQSGFCVNSVLVNVTNTELQIIFSGGDNWSWFGIGLGGDSMATASTMFILCNTEHTVTAAQRTSLGYIEPRVISKPDFQFIIDHDKSGFTLKLGKSSTQLLQTSSSILWAVGASTTTATTANVLDASQTGLPIHASKGVVVNPLLLIVSSDSISNTTSHIISHDKLLSSSSTAFASNSSISSSMTTTTSTDPQPPQLPPYPSPSNLFDSSSVLDNHPPSCANNPLSIRNEWRELSHEDRILFIEAVKCLMNTSSTSQWTPSNGSLYDDFVQHHNKVARQVHFTPMFIVFHRIFIIAYENALRTCGSGGVGEKGKFAHITLPYWDVSLDR